MEQGLTWIAGGLVLSLLEMTIPAFYLLSFGIGAMITGGVALAAPNLALPVQVLCWLFASLWTLYLLLHFFRKGSGLKSTAGQSNDGYLGVTGIIIADSGPYKNGRIRFQTPVLSATEWVCISEQALQAGAEAQVVGISGNTLQVAKK